MDGKPNEPECLCVYVQVWTAYVVANNHLQAFRRFFKSLYSLLANGSRLDDIWDNTWDWCFHVLLIVIANNLRNAVVLMDMNINTNWLYLLNCCVELQQ